MKQIFDWLREQINDAHRNFRIGGSRFMYVVDAVDIINEAEAKWEKDCCEWKIDNQSNFYIVYKTSCGNQRITGIVGEKYCCHCGKPIKISEVEQ